MFEFLKNHPFEIEAFFDYSLVLSFAVDKEYLTPLLPPCLEPDLLNDRYGFVAVAMVQTRHLRPKGFPEFMGRDFFLTGYRIFTRYTSNTGRRLRGLFILKSETDKKSMEWLGNIFTRYSYSTTDIRKYAAKENAIIQSDKSGFLVEFSTSEEQPMLPVNSPFRDWKEARRFAGPLPFTFTYIPQERKVLVVEGKREQWVPVPVHVIRYDFPFLSSLNLKSPVLANAFIVKNIPYSWKKGKIEIWKE